MDAENNELDDITGVLLELAEAGERDLFLTWIAVIVLYAQSIVSPDNVLALLEEIFESSSPSQSSWPVLQCCTHKRTAPDDKRF